MGTFIFEMYFDSSYFVFKEICLFLEKCLIRIDIKFDGMSGKYTNFRHTETQLGEMFKKYNIYFNAQW